MKNLNVVSLKKSDSSSALQEMVAKLSQLILRQHGCTVQYLEANDVSSEIKTALSTKSSVVHGENLYVAVLTHSTLRSVIEVKHGHDLEQDAIHSIETLCQLLLETALEKVETLEKIETLEAQLELTHLHQNQSEAKVVRMAHFRDTENTLIGSPRSEFQNEFDFPCLVEALSELDIFKMALEIHQTSARAIFVPFKDLESGIENSIEALNKLGRVTIYIPEIQDLSLDRQSALNKFLDFRIPKLSPQIIVGTTGTYGELCRSPQIDPAFLKKITIGYLQLNQPFSTYKKENLIQFFFEGLSGRSRLNTMALETLIEYLDPQTPTH